MIRAHWRYRTARIWLWLARRVLRNASMSQHHEATETVEYFRTLCAERAEALHFASHAR